MFFSWIQGPKIKGFCHKELIDRQGKRRIGGKVKDIKPVRSRNCARLALIVEAFILTHLPKKPPQRNFFFYFNSVWCNVVYCTLHLIMVITVGFVFYPDATML